jgi:predicted transcriptional regulator
MSESMTLSLDFEMKQKLDRLARMTSKAQTALVLDALREYLAVNEWQIQAIEDGIDQADNGQLIPHEEIRQKWEKKLAHSLD